MHKFIFMRLGLCEEAGEVTPPTSGGAATPPPATGKKEEGAAGGGEKKGDKGGEPPAAGAAAAAKPPTVWDRAVALITFKGKDDMVAELRSAKAESARLLAENTQLKSQVATFQQNEARLQTALDTAEKENKDVAKEVTHQLASAGVPETALPSNVKTPGTGAAASVEDLVEQVNAEKDPAKKGLLTVKLKAAREKLANKQGTGSN